MSASHVSKISEDSLAGSDSRGFLSFFTRKRFFLLLFFYFALHTLLRGLISETAGIDDCDQIVRAQIWSWGYGPQPPLYTWLLKIFLTVFGYNIYTVTALKELTLFGIYILAYANAQIVTRSHICAVAAAVAMQFNPSISWESHRELTHSILTSLFVMGTLLCFLKLKTGEWEYYIGFGICAALGTLSKPNFLFFLAALGMAATSLKQTRALVMNRKMIVGVIVAVALCSANIYWIIEHRELATSSMHKFKMGDGNAVASSMGKALFKWGTDLIAHIGPMIAVLALIFWKVILKPKADSAESKLLWRTLLFVLALTTASIVIFKVTGFRDRWLQPLFVWLPVLFSAVFREYIEGIRLKVVVMLGAVIALVVLILAPGRMLLTDRLKKNEILNTPYAAIANDLRSAVQNADVIIAGDYRIAGNLRLRFPNKFVTSPEFADLFPRVDGKCVLVWDTAAGAKPTRELLKFAQTVSGKATVGVITRSKEVLKYHRDRTVEFGTASLD